MYQRVRFGIAVSTVIALLFAAPLSAQLFESDSKRLGAGKMDIVVREIERRPRTSVLQIEIKKIGSSVGSSFFLVCSMRRLAILRGNYRYIVKMEEKPQPGQMIIGFLSSADEDPKSILPEYRAGEDRHAVIDLQQFAPICDGMK